jgi:hypothetical protein
MEFNLEKALQVLERTPAVIKLLLNGLDDEWTRNNEGGETWSPFDVVGHLLHGEVTDWVPRLEKILNEDGDKNFVPFDRFAQFKESEGKTLAQLLDGFVAAREKNLAIVRAKKITPADYQKTGIHPVFGAVTLIQLLSTWTVHDLSHINQITRVMAKQYRTATGPWIEYLNVLNDRIN